MGAPRTPQPGRDENDKESTKTSAQRQGRVPSRRSARAGFDEHVDGAGVIPYCIGSDNRVWVLLGRERFDSGWYGSHKWSAFAGSSLSQEVAWETASREFWEESLGVIGAGNSNSTANACVAMREALRDGDFDISIFMRFYTRTRRAAKTHVTYVKRVPFPSQIRERFGFTRDVALQLLRAQRTIDAALECIPDEKPFLRSGDGLWRYGEFVTVVCVHRVQLCDRRETMLVVFSGTGPVGRKHSITLTHAIEPSLRASAVLYQQVHALRKDLTIFVRNLPRTLREAPAFDVEFDGGGIVRGVRVKDEFLEKDDLCLWPVDHLRGIVAQPEDAERNFRHSFIPALAVALEFIARARPEGGQQSV